MTDLPGGDLPDYTVGIIGAGQVGTTILTKLLEVKDQFHNLKLMVSSRQPHLLRPFKQEFGVEVMFDNAKIAAECDIIFVCVLPSQAQEVFKDIRDVIKERSELAAKDRSKINPVIVTTCAAISYQKLRLMLKNALLLKPSINVPLIKEYLFRAQAIVKVR